MSGRETVSVFLFLVGRIIMRSFPTDGSTSSERGREGGGTEGGREEGRVEGREGEEEGGRGVRGSEREGEN